MSDKSKIKWPPETSEVIETLKQKIADILETDEQVRADFETFRERLHATPDGSIKVSRAEAIEFFAIYLVTKPAQEAIFDRLQRR